MNGPRFNFSEVSPDEYRAEMDAFDQQHEKNCLEWWVRLPRRPVYELRIIFMLELCEAKILLSLLNDKWIVLSTVVPGECTDFLSVIGHVAKHSPRASRFMEYSVEIGILFTHCHF
jgi:hypothetical protein